MKNVNGKAENKKKRVETVERRVQNSWTLKMSKVKNENKKRKKLQVNWP